MCAVLLFFLYFTHIFWQAIPAKELNKAEEKPLAPQAGALADQMLQCMMARFAVASAGILGHNEPQLHFFGHKQPSASLTPASPPTALPLCNGNAEVAPVSNAVPLDTKQKKLTETEGQPSTLEDFEEKSMEALVERQQGQGGKKAKKQPVLKKPAGAKALVKKPEKKGPVMKRPAARTAAPVQQGCMRCRGLGCDKCSSPDFQGLRLTRQEWVVQQKLRNLK